jgi:hypothetical protein
MENKVYVMTAKQVAKAFPRDKELYARLKVLQDSGFEPYIDDEHPDLSDEARYAKKKLGLHKSFNIFNLFWNIFR